jgi:hypothetical protein
MVTSMYTISYTYMPRKLPLPSTQTQLFAGLLGASLDLRQLLKLFTKLICAFNPLPLAPGRKRKSYQRIFCHRVTLWGMILQCLLKDRTLDRVVASFRHRKANAFSAGKKPLSTRIKSKQTTSCSNARQRLRMTAEKWRESRGLKATRCFG